MKNNRSFPSVEIVEEYSYDVFGEPTIYDENGSEINEPNMGNAYLFTGRRYDDESDMYYYRARYYKPDIGRFLQTDPIPALNLYTYVDNNPLNWIDPWGLCKEAKELTDEDLLREMVSTYNKHLSGISRWGGPGTILRIMPTLDTRRFFPGDTSFIYNGQIYTAEEINYIGVGMGFRHFIFLPGSHFWVNSVE